MLTKYTTDSQRTATLMVWARQDGIHKGDGYSYRIQDLLHVDTANTVIVEEYEKNTVSLIIDNVVIMTVSLQNQILLRKEEVSGSKKALKVSDLDFKLQGNSWSLSETVISGEKFFELTEEKKKEEEEPEDDNMKYSFWVGISLIVMCILTFAFIGWRAMKMSTVDEIERIDSNDVTLLSRGTNEYGN